MPICCNLRAVLQLKRKPNSIAKNNLNLYHIFLREAQRRLIYNPPHVIISSFPFLPDIFKAHGYFIDALSSNHSREKLKGVLNHF